jgi:hypothetical protein
VLVAKVFSDQAASSKSIRCTEAYSGDVEVPPGGGTFWFQIFIQAPSLEIRHKTIFGGEGTAWRGKWGGLFWATSLEKIFGGATAIVSYSRWMDTAVYRAEVCYPFGGSTGVTSSETAQVHHAARRHSCAAVRNTRAAASRCLAISANVHKLVPEKRGRTLIRD